MVPVDEYIPIMYDRHPNTTWSNQFPIRYRNHFNEINRI